eukprot:superscaffoldBa00004465_g18923
MGNNKARQLYEAHLPENFRRPQTDQAVEVFIRDKYERKKYYDKEALDAAPLALLLSLLPSSVFSLYLHYQSICACLVLCRHLRQHQSRKRRKF